MANKKIIDEKVPKISMAQAIKQLEYIHENVFKLKNAMRAIAEVIREGNDETAKKALDIFTVDEVLQNLDQYNENI